MQCYVFHFIPRTVIFFYHFQRVKFVYWLLYRLPWSTVISLKRLFESDCLDYCDKALLSQHTFSINVWGQNRHEQALDLWALPSGYLIPFVVWNDTLLSLPYANDPKSVPLRIQRRLSFATVICCYRLRLWLGYFTCFKITPVIF